MALVFVLIVAAGAGVSALEAQFGFFGRRPDFLYEPDPPRTEFVFARIRYTTHGGSFEWSGWEHDYPQAEHHINTLAGETTLINVERMSYQIVDMDDPELFKYPFAYISEPGTMRLDPAEVANFREYLDRGGFVMVDDFDGLDDLSNWQFNLKQVYPDREMIPLTVNHAIFHAFYDIIDLGITAGGASPGYPVFFGYPAENGRDINMIICFNNDIGDYWEWLDQPVYPLEPSAEGVRLGINFLIYSMTH